MSVLYCLICLFFYSTGLGHLKTDRQTDRQTDRSSRTSARSLAYTGGRISQNWGIPVLESFSSWLARQFLAHKHNKQDGELSYERRRKKIAFKKNIQFSQKKRREFCDFLCCDWQEQNARQLFSSCNLMFNKCMKCETDLTWSIKRRVKSINPYLILPFAINQSLFCSTQPILTLFYLEILFGCLTVGLNSSKYALQYHSGPHSLASLLRSSEQPIRSREISKMTSHTVLVDQLRALTD